MNRGLLLSVSGSCLLLFGFLLKIIVHSKLLGSVPLFMGPPVIPSVLHDMRMWSFPYVLDTISFIAFGTGITLVVLGIVIAFRSKMKLSSTV